MKKTTNLYEEAVKMERKERIKDVAKTFATTVIKTTKDIVLVTAGSLLAYGIIEKMAK